MAGQSFRNVDFTGANLSGVDFTGADLVGANFTNADLSFANFKNAQITHATFENSNTTSAIELTIPTKRKAEESSSDEDVKPVRKRTKVRTNERKEHYFTFRTHWPQREPKALSCTFARQTVKLSRNQNLSSEYLNFFQS